MLTPPGFGSPQALRTEQTGARSAYAASPKALIAKPTTASYAPSTWVGNTAGEVSCARWEHGLPCVGEGFGCHDEHDDAVEVVNGSCATLTLRLRNTYRLTLQPSGWLVQHFREYRHRLFVGKRLESGRRNSVPGVGGDPCAPNGKSPKLGLCSLVGGLPVRPLAIRCGVCAGQLPFDTPRVREHPAPSGALRPSGREMPSMSTRFCQGAPSTIRCIKTPKSTENWGESAKPPVREHPAPSGALRRISGRFVLLRRRKSGSTQHHQVH